MKRFWLAVVLVVVLGALVALWRIGPKLDVSPSDNGGAGCGAQPQKSNQAGVVTGQIAMPGGGEVNVRHATVSPDGKRALVVLNGSAHQLVLYDLESGRRLCCWKSGGDTVFHIFFLPAEEGRFVLTSTSKSFPGKSYESDVTLVETWDVQDPRHIRLVNTSRFGRTEDWSAISPDGKFALSNKNLYNVSTGELVKKIDISTGVWCSDSKRIVAWRGLLGDLQVWNVEKEHCDFHLENGKYAIDPSAFPVVVSDDDNYVLAPFTVHENQRWTTTEVGVWDLNTGKQLRTFSKHKEPIKALAIGTDGKTVYSADQSGQLFSWDIRTTEVLHENSLFDLLRYQPRFVPCPGRDWAFIGSGARGWGRAAGADSLKLVLIDLPTGEAVRTFQAP